MGLLKGMKVLDFSTLLPGPYATLLLADMGANVLRVESPTRVDLVKEMEPTIDGVSAAHHYLHRSKRSIALDLKKPEAITLIKNLIREYDVVIEQFRPGVMERLGLGYEQLKKVNPKIIYCSLTSFGQTGPFRDRPGHDNNFLALSGIVDYSRRKGERPTPSGIQIADLAGGSLQSVIAILAAYIHREKTGEGEYIDVSMTDAAFALNAMFGSGALVEDVSLEPESLLLNGGTFYDYYETEDERYFSVGSLEPQFKKQLCEAIGRPDLLELAMGTTEKEMQQFKQALTTRFKEKTFGEWLAIFDQVHCCVEPVLTFQEASEHPQIAAREMVVEVPTASGKRLKQIAFPVKFKFHPVEYKETGCKTDAHRMDILKEIGVTEEQVQQLEAAGVIGNE